MSDSINNSQVEQEKKINEPNYTQIPNVIFDYWMNKLSPSAFTVLLALCRKTFGWHKTTETISKNQLIKLTGISKNTVTKSIDELININLIIVHKFQNEYGNQPNQYSLNIIKPKDELYTDQNLGGGRSKIDPGGRSKIDPHINKDNINKYKKENITKEKAVDKSTLASSDAHFCSEYLFEKLKTIKKNAQEPKWFDWDKTFEKMIRIDKIPKEKIIESIDFVYRPGSTWAVQSANSLREKYERIDFHIQKELITKMPKVNQINDKEDKKILSVIGIINNWIMNETNDPIKVNMGTLKIENNKIIGPYGKFYKKTFDELMKLIKNEYKAPSGLMDKINEKCNQIDSISNVYKQNII